MRKIVFVAILFFILFSGCSKLDTKIDAPSYIEISDYTVITDSLTQGSSNQKFTDVVVTSSTKNYGYYPIPGKIPLPLDGSTYLSIRPVILVNGVKFLRFDYPVMKGCDSTFPLKRGEVLQVKPVFKYFNTATFPFLEDLEKPNNVNLKNSDPLDTFCVKLDSANAAYGVWCLNVKLDGTHPICQVQSNSGFTLPTGGPSIYAEFNYKGNFPLEVGVIGSSSPGIIFQADQRSAGGVNPSGAWKKMYVDLTNIVRTPPFSQYYFLYFYTRMDFGDGSVANPLIYIDNIKVVRQ